MNGGYIELVIGIINQQTSLGGHHLVWLGEKFSFIEDCISAWFFGVAIQYEVSNFRSLPVSKRASSHLQPLPAAIISYQPFSITWHLFVCETSSRHQKKKELRQSFLWTCLRHWEILPKPVGFACTLESSQEMHGHQPRHWNCRSGPPWNSSFAGISWMRPRGLSQAPLGGERDVSNQRLLRSTWRHGKWSSFLSSAWALSSLSGKVPNKNGWFRGTLIYGKWSMSMICYLYSNPHQFRFPFSFRSPRSKPKIHWRGGISPEKCPLRILWPLGLLVYIYKKHFLFALKKALYIYLSR